MRVRGTLEERGEDWVVLSLGPVSLRLSMPAREVAGLPAPGTEVTLHTLLLVREETPTLYGFTSPTSLEVFRLLMWVSGVGPRLALAVLSGLGPEAVLDAIARGNPEALAQASGVGRRLASRIVVELRGRVRREAPAPTGEQEDLVSALVALGFSLAEARRAVASVRGGPEQPLEERLREALRLLGRS